MHVSNVRKVGPGVRLSPIALLSHSKPKRREGDVGLRVLLPAHSTVSTGAAAYGALHHPPLRRPAALSVRQVPFVTTGGGGPCSRDSLTAASSRPARGRRDRGRRPRAWDLRVFGASEPGAEVCRTAWGPCHRIRRIPPFAPRPRPRSGSGSERPACSGCAERGSRPFARRGVARRRSCGC